MANKKLDLNITVSGSDPDGTLHEILSRSPKNRAHVAQLKYGVLGLEVDSIARADGAEIGLEAEFEEYWGETFGGADCPAEETLEKSRARDAFLHGVKYARNSPR